jgi:hypothetical protein
MIYSLRGRDELHARRIQFACILSGLETERFDDHVDIVAHDPYKILGIVKAAGGEIVAEVDLLPLGRV